MLILRRAATAYGEGSWCLPGGKVDYGESVEQTIAKELAEETGLRHVSSRFLFFQDSLPPQPGGMHCVNLYFEVRAEGDLRLNRESSECAWVTPSDVSSYQIVFGNDEALEKYWNRTLV